MNPDRIPYNGNQWRPAIAQELAQEADTISGALPYGYRPTGMGLIHTSYLSVVEADKLIDAIRAGKVAP